MKLIEAMAKMEGFGADPNNRPTRNNNPGDIEYGPFAKAHGADRIETVPQGETARFAHFPTVELGFGAMKALLQQNYAGLTVEEAITKYAPPTENNTEAYIKEVCKWANVERTAPIERFL